ncbi:Polysaccharide biosynthesis/export protein [Mucilaginibacter gotjawali]|nr:polysaccharide biosynthesis/export family protein [Mucilaginibacter gotjawali]BAU54360.1 Polysaccharide biosynthesis/export protein [Mucilaginibacter gotjawali]
MFYSTKHLKAIYPAILIFTAIAFMMSSCVDQKQIAYFQKGSQDHDTITVAQAFVPKIQTGDILSISVGSLNPMASSFFNPYSTMPVASDNPTGGNTGGGGAPAAISQPAAPGFLVDSAGIIEIPLIGSIKVSGLSTSQLRVILKKRLVTYLKEPTVNVRFLNYKISIMGEVARPSVYVIPNEQITLPEALSMAGDLTIFGKRDNVLVIREHDGKKEFGHVNLNSRELYSSPYYYLHSNDVIYVEPGKGRIAQTDKTYQILPIILSALSFIAIIFSYSHIKL